MTEEDRTPLAFVCDEAHLYLPAVEDTDAIERRALASFERIAKEGRKYGVALFVVSQRPSDVSRTILSQCNNFLAMRLTNDRDQAVVRRFVSESLSGLIDTLPLLDVGEVLILGDAMLLPTRVKLAKPRIKPDSATRDFWTEWGKVEPRADAISASVEALRRQVRAPAK
jgi:DNA helicase HerA-like ATPase